MSRAAAKRLPFRPASREDNAARLPEAVQKLYDADAVARGEGTRPGLHRRHVLDYPDGLRVIVSRERVPARSGGEVFVHVSASLEPGTGLYARGRLVSRAAGRKAAYRWFRTHVEALLAELFPDEELRFVGFSRDKGVPHWVIPEADATGREGEVQG